MGENDVLTVLNEEKQKSQQTIIGTNVTEENKQEELLEQRTFLYDALSDEEANRVLKNLKHRLVVLIGLPSSGKSTFVGSMYHLLMTKTSVGNYRILGSDTYVGLERRVYLRYAHGQNISDTKRTGSLEGHMLTLEIEEKSSHEKIQLFLSDRTGERYIKYAKGEANIKDDASLLAAEHLYIFVAADTLTGSEYLSVKDKYEKIAIQLKSAGLIDKIRSVTIVFNKIDLVQKVRERFFKKRALFLDAMKVSLGVDDIDNCDVQSNNMNATELKLLIEKLMSSAFDDRENSVSDEIDWVKREIKKYVEL